MCTREGEALDSLRLDAGYLFKRGHLSGLHVKVDSGTAFDPLLAAFTKRYGQPRSLRRGTAHAFAQWRFREGKLQLTRTGTLVIAQFTAAS